VEVLLNVSYVTCILCSCVYRDIHIQYVGTESNGLAHNALAQQKEL